MVSITPYCTLEEAQTYFDDVRLDADAWDDSESLKQLKALKAATLSIDRLSFIGKKTTSTQLYEFPRDGDTLVPDEIKRACCELALAFLDGVDPDLEDEALGDVVDAYATVRVTSDVNVRKDHIKAGIPSIQAWRFLLPYLNDPLAIVIRRG